jgi:DNA-directed RNA polymerase subunit M/transcription elongation factor TFIIS
MHPSIRYNQLRMHTESMVLWNDNDPPPCPWCGQERARRLPAQTDVETRFFECIKCKRQFLVSWAQLTPKPAE